MSGTDWLRDQIKKQERHGPDILPTADERNSSEVEAWLRTFDVSYSAMVKLPLEKIDRKRSQSNQARSEALVDEAVSRFVIALNNGERLPPIIVYPVANKAVIVDGNNREAAHRKARLSHIDAFIISEETPSEVIQAMTVAANTRHGTTPDLQWRLRQAMYLMELGHHEEDACRHAAVTKSQLKNFRLNLRARGRAKGQGIREFSSLANQSQLALASIPLDTVFTAAAGLAVRAGMSITDTASLVREIKALGTEEAQLQVISREAASRDLALKAKEVLKRKTTIKNAKTGLLTGLGKILAADPAELKRQVVTDPEREEIVKRCYAAAEHLIEVIDAFKVIKEDDETEERAHAS